MWNWLVSSLSIGSTIVLFDGSPFYPNSKEMWKLVDRLDISIFGTSAKYIDACRESGMIPSKFADLSKLRLILSTGSPLVEENYDYVYQNVKEDVLLGSISGGTDIISCFALSNPMLPVTRGELQCKGLGMNVHSFNDKGESLINEKGELVCLSPFPSMPIYFWNDKNEQKYRSAYFETFEGIWHHGDFIQRTKNNGFIILGRSDATLNPGGVRLGTAEIYRQVENIDFIRESLVVGQNLKDDVKVILFVLLKTNKKLDEKNISLIKDKIKRNCSPKHVPYKIIQVPDIPRTKNGKIVELAVKNIIEGNAIKNKEALSNPEILNEFKNLEELQY